MILGQRSAHLLAEIDFLAHINDGHLLGGGDNDSSIYLGSLQELGYGNVLVRRSAHTETNCWETQPPEQHTSQEEDLSQRSSSTNTDHDIVRTGVLLPAKQGTVRSGKIPASTVLAA